MKLLKILILVYLLTGVVACIPKPIPVKVKPAEVKLVVASSIIPNRAMFVSLTRSFSGIENKQNEDSLSADLAAKILVKNAQITVRYGNRVDTLYKLSDGLYGSINTLLTNFTAYELRARDLETGLEISANTNMLPNVRFDSIKPYKKFSTADTTCWISFRLSDNTNTENYYVVNYSRKLNKKNNTNINIDQVFSNGSASFENYFDLLNDDAFNNGVYRLNKELPGVLPSDSLAVSVANISKGYYEFLSAFKRSGSLINTLTGEPINYPSNVQNGYGYFNAYYPQILFFDMKNY